MTFVGFSGDGKRVITVEEDKKDSVWALLDTCKPEKTFLIPSEVNQDPDSTIKVVYSSSGNLLAVVRLIPTEENDITTCKVWLCKPTDNDETNVLAQFEMNIRGILNLSFSPDEKWLVGVNADNQLELLLTESESAKTGAELQNHQTVEGIWDRPIHTISWNQDGKLLTIYEENSYDVHEWEICVDNGGFALEPQLSETSQSFPKLA